MENRKIDTFLGKEFRIGAARFTVLDALFVAAVTAAALVARFYLFPIKSGDFNTFLNKWLGQIRDAGAFHALGLQISDYASPYMYLMSIASLFGNGLYALKAISVIFDFIGATAIALLVWHLTGSERKTIAGFAFTILCPTVMVNSAWWCQCDMIYCTFVLFALLFLFKDKSLWCCIFLGLAFSFKMQTVFILPFIVMMWLKGRTIKLWHLLVIPAVYLVMHIPAMIAGRPFMEVISIYFNQTTSYPYGTLKFPNIYEFFEENMQHRHHMAEMGGWGVWFSLGVVGTLAWWIASRKFKVDKTIMVTLALFSVCVVLFTMPHMHERYGFLVDLLAIVYVLQRPKKAPVALLYIIISLLTYMPFLNRAYVFPISVLAVVYMGLTVYVGFDLYKQINDNAEIPARVKKGR